MLKLPLLILVLITSPAQAHAEYDPSDDLMGFFGTRCESLDGAIDSEAFSEGDSLKSILVAMKNDPDCGVAYSALDQLASLELGPTGAEANLTATIQSTQLKQQAQQLEVAYRAAKADPNVDANYLSALDTAWANATVAAVEAQSGPSPALATSKIASINNLRTYAANALQQLQSRPLCMQHFPNAAAQIGAQALAISSSFVPGMLGPVMLAAGSFVDHYIDYLHNRSLNGHYRGLVKTQMKQALGCGLEAMALTYCDAEDLKTILNSNAAAQEAGPEQTDWLGSNIVAQDLPAFNNWVVYIIAGSSASSTAQATNQQASLQLRTDADKFEKGLEGSLGTTRDKLANLGTGGSEKQELENLVDVMSRSCTGADTTQTYNVGTATLSETGFLSKLFIDDPTCGPYAYFWSKGQAFQCNRGANTSESCLQCVKDPSNHWGVVPPAIDELVSLTADLMSLARKSIASDIAISLESNARSTLGKSLEIGPNQKTPMDFLNAAIPYLHSLAKSNSVTDPNLQETLYDLLDKLDFTQCILGYTDHCKPGYKPKAKVEDRLEDLRMALAPQGDSFYVSSALYMLVKVDLDYRLKNATADQKLALALQLSPTDSLSTLIAQALDVDTALAQANNAEDATRRNLESFGELFSGQISDLLKDDQKQKSQTFALDCARALLIPGAPKLGGFDLSSVCRGQVWKSIYTQSGITLNFDQIAALPFEKRVCTFHDFFRKSQVYGYLLEKKKH